MKRGYLIAGIVTLVLMFIVFSFNFSITGNIVGLGDEGYSAPSKEETECMYNCVEINNKTENECLIECGIDDNRNKLSEDELCMEECIVKGCDKFDFDCQGANVENCEKECGMMSDAPDESEMSEEEKCIMECVNKVDPTIRCESGQEQGEGERGGEVCKRCAQECLYLYEGPCLTEEEWEEKEKECMAKGEHMETIEIMGDSGEGWECVIDLECVDRSDEWGNESGEGPGIGDEGYVAPNVVMEVVDNIVGFFKDLF